MNKYAIILVFISGLIIRIWQTDFLEPLFFDANLYNNFAWNFSHNLGSLPPLHNIGFPLLLSLFFSITPDFMTSSIIQKSISVILSSLTIPLVYMLARRFLSSKYSLLAASLIAFEPHMILNSTFGITEAQYIFLFVSSLYLGTGRRFVPIAFILAGLATITRFEGVVLLPILTGLVLYHSRPSLKTITKIILYIILFAIPVFAATYYNLNVGTHENIVTAKITHEEFVADKVLVNNSSTLHIILNSLLYLGWSTYPIFIWFIPPALYFAFKENKRNAILIISLLSLLTFPGFFAYLRAYDTRYFMQLYPVLAILAAYVIRELISRNIIQKILKHEAVIYSVLVIACGIGAVYLMTSTYDIPTVYAVGNNKTVVIFPTYTLAAYDRNGFYDYYKGKCGTECLTIPDRFNDISSITYHAYGIDKFRQSGYDMISDRDLDSNPGILKMYKRIIVLHNEYVTKKEFTAITNSKNVVYLYPNALYAMVNRNPDNTLTLVRGHNYPTHDITNGFAWQYDNSNIEYDRACKNIHFYKIPNGTMLNCYPEDIINSSPTFWEALSKI